MEIQLSEEQQRVIEYALAGHNIFVTGVPGSGKSATLGKLIEILSKTRCVTVTSMTGVSALSINGITFHSFMSCGIVVPETFAELELRIEEIINKRFMYSKTINRFKDTDCIIIDECSLLSSLHFYWFDMLARRIRKEENTRYFGGIQVILVGDFLQCEVIHRPILHGTRQLTLPDAVSHPAFTEKFLFNTPLWKSSINKTVVLTKSFRQQDSEFFGLLTRLRHNELTENDINMLKSRIMENTRGAPTCFYTNALVNNYNINEYAKLPGCDNVFTATFGLVQKVETVTGVNFRKIPNNSVSKDVLHKNIDKLKSSVAVPCEIKIKVGTKLLLRKNIDVTRGLANGTIATVTKISSGTDMFNGSKRLFPTIEYEYDGSKKKIMLTNTPSFMLCVKDDIYVAMYQIPVSYGWSTTINKTQGLTIASLHGSTESIRPKTGGTVYVMLSRVRSLSDITFTEFDEKTIYFSPEIVEFDKQILRQN